MTQACFELAAILWPQPSTCEDYRYEPTCPALSSKVNSYPVRQMPVVALFLGAWQLLPFLGESVLVGGHL